MAEPYSFLVNDTTLPSNNPLRFRQNHFNIYIIKIMTINDQIRDEKLHMILIEKKRKYQLYHQVKFINMNILPVKIYYHLISSK